MAVPRTEESADGRSRYAFHVTSKTRALEQREVYRRQAASSTKARLLDKEQASSCETNLRSGRGFLPKREILRSLFWTQSREDRTCSGRKESVDLDPDQTLRSIKWCIAKARTRPWPMCKGVGLTALV